MNADTASICHQHSASHPPSIGQALPPALAGLVQLATDLRWTWSHAADSLWQQIDAALWLATQNPFVVLQNVAPQRMQVLADDPTFCQHLGQILQERSDYLNRCGWYQSTYPTQEMTVAFFSMEFGLGDALPFYAGGLGILSGDILKTASDLCIPMVGVGLLYSQGYLHQMIDANHQQVEIYPASQTSLLPITPVCNTRGQRLEVSIELPGRMLFLRVWQATVGSVSLYLLDSNHPLNSPADQGITSQLYGGNQQLRLLQQLVLGIGGWRALDACGHKIDVCHLNEGHAAFATLARTASLMTATGLNFETCFWINRAGTLFTTHSPVASAFDTYETGLITQYLRPLADLLDITPERLLALGRQQPDNQNEAFNLAWFAMRSSLCTNAVSRKHCLTSRRLFCQLFPRWPLADVPVGYTTNGVHMPSWDSPWADSLWTDAAGKGRWRGGVENLAHAIEQLGDRELWEFRNHERLELIELVRKHDARSRSQRGEDHTMVEQRGRILDPNILTIGFARRFTDYKRPLLLLRDRCRLERLLNDPLRPIQLLIAGKAHPRDEQGKACVQAWSEFSCRPEAANRVVFIEDYDIALARELVQGVDVWLNTPRSPWEACGTSGMKVLVNGGLNLSVLEGWWDEAFSPECGWAVTTQSDHDDDVASRLFDVLEYDVIPTFYHHDDDGMPARWIQMIRASMARLTPQYCSNRMLKEYIEQRYLPLHAQYQRRLADGGQLAIRLSQWQQNVTRYWPQLRWRNYRTIPQHDGFTAETELYLGDLSPDEIQVQLYADPVDQWDAECHAMTVMSVQSAAIHSYVYTVHVATSRPATHFTPRALPFHPDASVPQEISLISWFSR